MHFVGAVPFTGSVTADAYHISGDPTPYFIEKSRSVEAQN